MEPPELLVNDTRLVAYFPDLPDQKDLLEEISTDDHSANTGNETDAQHDARRETNCDHKQCREEARQH